MKNSTKKRRVRADTAPLPDPDDEFLTTEEAAERLKRSVKTLEFWRLVGKGPPFYRQSRAIRYLLSEVMAWGASNRIANEDTAA